MSTTATELEFEHDKTTVLFGVKNRPGALSEALNLFSKHDMDMTHIVSRPSKTDNEGFEFEIDFKGDEFDDSVTSFLGVLRDKTRHLRVLGRRQVPWFPRHISDFDHFTQKTLDAGDDLESDHPGFNDAAYRDRRSAITEMAKSYKAGMGKIPNPIPPVEYSDSEMGAWGQVTRRSETTCTRPRLKSAAVYDTCGLWQVYDRLMQLYPLYACSEANANMKLLQVVRTPYSRALYF